MRRFFIGVTALTAVFVFLFWKNPDPVDFDILPERFGFGDYRLPLGVLLFFAFLSGLISLGVAGLLLDGRSALSRLLGGRDGRLRDRSEELEIEGRDLLDAGDRLGAARAFRGAVKKNPRRAGAWIGFAESLVLLGDPEGAGKAFSRAEELSFDSPSDLLLLAGVYDRLGRSEAALEALQRLRLTGYVTLEVLRRQAECCKKSRQWRRFSQVQEILVQRTVDPAAKEKEKKNLAAGLYAEAEAHLAGGDGLKEAYRSLESALRVFPADVPSRVLMGDLFQKEGKAKLALKAWRKGLDLTGAVVLAERMAAHHAEADDPQEAADVFRRAINKRGEKAGALRLALARFLAGAGRVEEAEAELEKEPASGGLARKVLLADIQARQGRTAEALSSLRGVFSPGGELAVGYRCASCGVRAGRWSAACPRCGEHGSLDAENSNDQHPGPAKAAPPLDAESAAGLSKGKK